MGEPAAVGGLLVKRNIFLRGTALALLVVSASGAVATQLPNSVVPGVAQAQVVGTPPSSKTVYFTISLKPRYPAELEAFCKSVSDPRSDSYRHWLTPAQVGLQFGATATTVNNVTTYLRAKGITVTLQAPNRMAIMAQGTVAQVQSAFNTTIKSYRGPDIAGNMIDFQSNSTPLNVPAAWASQVQAITGIENWNHPFPKVTQTLTPPLTRGCYGLVTSYNMGLTGQGRTIGITNFDGFRLSNVPLYCSAFNLPVPPGGAGSNITVVTIQGGSGGGAPFGEGDLDIQMELGTAPLANIIIYDGGGDQTSVLTKEASDNLAEVMSESYGFFYPDSTIPNANHNQHLAMTAQGQTYMEATGDAGTDIIGDYNGSDPEIFGVGGTVATVDSNTGARQSEVAWDGGGGGWTTTTYSFNKRPAWQQGPGIPATPNQRLMPDIAMQAGGPGAFTIYYNGGQVAFDGTSCSSPCFAGGLAVIEQQLELGGTPPRLGRVADAIYLQQGRSDVWFDITQGSNGILPNGQTSNAGPNWDFCGGWGAPNFDALAHALVQQIIMTPYVPTSISTALGTYLI
nr:protease pro-enzyme activation domain-containing protein [Fimbriimonadaceae bacterium]